MVVEFSWVSDLFNISVSSVPLECCVKRAINVCFKFICLLGNTQQVMFRAAFQEQLFRGSFESSDIWKHTWWLCRVSFWCALATAAQKMEQISEDEEMRKSSACLRMCSAHFLAEQAAPVCYPSVATQAASVQANSYHLICIWHFTQHLLSSGGSSISLCSLKGLSL